MPLALLGEPRGQDRAFGASPHGSVEDRDQRISRAVNRADIVEQAQLSNKVSSPCEAAADIPRRAAQANSRPNRGVERLFVGSPGAAAISAARGRALDS